jgi:hypothetical protein
MSVPTRPTEKPSAAQVIPSPSPKPTLTSAPSPAPAEPEAAEPRRPAKPIRLMRQTTLVDRVKA